ncbi:MAG: hypothetical protein J2P23_03840 [Microlunatus sp.]|nr:hypothetical protein [Microlunatus sp.]
MIGFTILVLAVAGERLAELSVARRNRRWSVDHGGIEYGSGHYPAVVAVQIGLLAGCLVEVWWRQPAFVPLLGIPMLILVFAAQALRWWCIRTLGPRWNTRVIIVPGLPLVRRGPYRVLNHPNYVAVVAEGLALPLVHTAWITALAFTVVNSAILIIRIRVENRALRSSRTPR